MLFSEAAKLAKEGNVKELWLTHFSPSLIQPEEFLKNASNIFSNTKIGEDRMKLELFFSK
jgi:ribonuclease Z